MGNYTGTTGDDVFPGSGGADTMTGGAGNDTYYVDDAGDVVVEETGGGQDRVAASVSYILAANAEVELIEAITLGVTDALDFTGSDFANTIYGNNGINFLRGQAGNDTLWGFGGNDYLIGGTGSDVMYGGDGNDTFYVDDAGDVVNEAAGEGNDRIAVSVSFALSADSEIELIEAVNLASTDALSLTGSDFANTIYGNEGVNFLVGAGGNDTMFGFGGTDYLTGGTGTDIMYGGAGNDTFYVDDSSDRAYENAGEGIDRIAASVDYALSNDSEVELLEAVNLTATNAMNLSGSDSANTISGNDGANVLRGEGGNDTLAGAGGDDVLVGGAGIDTMAGGTGNDVYHVDNALDVVAEAAGAGNDRVAASASYALAANAEVEQLEAVTQSATNAIDLTGSDTANVILGNDGANALAGGGGNDTLWGFGGSDVLTGGAGADTMTGGDGDDSYYVDDAADAVIEAGGPGTGVLDIVYASVSYTIAAGQRIESLQTADAAGQTALNLTGNSFTQEIRGNAGNNVLTGLGGSFGKSFFGGLGADTLVSDGINNRYYFDTALGNGNIDTIPNFTGTIMLAGAAAAPFAALAIGQLRGDCFVVGPAALDANDYLIYNNATGALLYDADGNGAGAAVQFATLPAGLTGLNSGIFSVVGASGVNQAPTLTSGATATVAENMPASTIVYQAAATDLDGDRITYNLSGGDAGLFNIDGATGAVRLNNPADFETKSSYSFFVDASDSSGGQTKLVTLTITNLPDATPTPHLGETATANDTAATAQVVARDTLALGDNPNLPDAGLPSIIIDGNIASSSDKDFFSITLAEGELLILDVDNSGGNLDTLLKIFAQGGNTLVASNDDLVTADPGSAPHPDYGHNTDSFLRFRAPVAGTYIFSIESFPDPEHPTLGSYELNVSVGPPVAEAQLFAEDIEALLSGESWNHNALTYGFPTSAGQYPPGIEETDQPGEFAPFTGAQQAATTQLLQLIANVANLTFAPAGANPGNADLRYAMSSEADVAYAYYPTNEGPGDLGGSAWFNRVDFNAPAKGNYAWMGILHETGHALGLKHGHEAPAVNAIHDTVEYTVMTYRSHVFSPVDDENAGYTNETWSYPQTLMMLDIAALQRLYGANFTYNATDSVYRWDLQTVEMSINNVGQGAPGGQRLFLTVWDGGGIDTYDCSNFNNHVTIDLRPGEWSTMAQGWLASLGNGSSAAGNVANALLYNGDARSLIENAIGGAGQDLLVANQAKNVLTGGGQIDTYQWHSVADIGKGAQGDVVNDGGNNSKFDLFYVDANSNTAANDAFTFIGQSAFHGVAGELNYQVEGAMVHIMGDVDGDAIADFDIFVTNTQLLFSSDFVL